ncbi:MAG: FAD-dependent oxidoreductase [Bacteroidales bacterium]|nr:FAD-dependent oxidoreductase [Bacteroidales bacterium]
MKSISIIGAGPAGIEAATILAHHNYQVTVFEKSASAMKNIADKAFLFPNFVDAKEIVEEMCQKLVDNNITVKYDTDIVGIHRDAHGWLLEDQKGENYFADNVLLATGYTPFDAHRKEELGYGIYGGVVTSLDMETMIRYDRVLNTVGEKPKRIAFLQCVGSRDEKSGNHYCSKVCCVTAVKQAIEVKKQVPDCEVYVFYMDLRMWGQGFEEMYREAQQQYGIRFVRGRISEASGTFDKRVQIKSEDTLMGLPLRMTTDLLVLMVGMEPSAGTCALAKVCGIAGDYGFAQSADPHLHDNKTAMEGLFVCGTCKRPMSLTDAVNDGRSAALAIME